ncbi:MAG: tRNA (adenosine(37)-N6)-threonylcarbamoyltransferase complex ATPase subunit type 1 TsaE [Candidatus Vogelbacteria bacterium]
MEIISHSLAETADLASKILVELAKTGREKKATLVALQGDLGSGKTTFTQAVARVLGITGRVTSPTFVIMKTYRLSEGDALPIGKASPSDNR